MSKKQKLDELLNRPGPSNEPEMSQDQGSRPFVRDEDHTGQRTRRALRFEDIEQTFRKFTGENGGINTWINNFEQQSEIFQLSELEKLVYAKRLMSGNALLFLQYESQATTYNELKRELIEEYGQQKNSAPIHQKLKERKKKKEEDTTQYLYEMMAIAAEANIDTPALITYVIDGLPAPPPAKAHMYEAQTTRQLKQKLAAYEVQQRAFQETRRPNNKPQHDKATIEKPKHGNARGERRNRCYNCGARHETSECPDKDKGP